MKLPGIMPGSTSSRSIWFLANLWNVTFESIPACHQLLIIDYNHYLLWSLIIDDHNWSMTIIDGGEYGWRLIEWLIDWLIDWWMMMIMIDDNWCLWMLHDSKALHTFVGDNDKMMRWYWLRLVMIYCDDDGWWSLSSWFWKLIMMINWWSCKIR